LLGGRPFWRSLSLNTIAGKNMKFLFFLLCLLPLCACVKHPAPGSQPVAVQAPVLQELEELATLREQFLAFRADDVFLRYGFTFNSPYADWLQRVRDLEQNPAMAEGARLLAGLAVAFRIHGEQSEVYRQFETRFDHALRSPVEDEPVSQPVALQAPPPATGISILFSGDTQGSLFPRPGLSRSVGGLARRMPTIAHFRAAAPGVLLLDAGDAFSSEVERAEIVNKTLVRAMNRMHYDAMGLGVRDLSMGEVALRELAGMAAFPLVCSNLVFQKGVAPWIKPYALIMRERYRIAVMSLMPVPSDAVITGARLMPPAEALRALLPELRSKADFVVLLTQFGSAEMAALLGGDFAVDAILGDSEAVSRKNPAYIPAVPRGLGFGFVRLERNEAGAPCMMEAMPVLLGAGFDAQIVEIMNDIK